MESEYTKLKSTLVGNFVILFWKPNEIFIEVFTFENITKMQHFKPFSQNQIIFDINNLMFVSSLMTWAASRIKK